MVRKYFSSQQQVRRLCGFLDTFSQEQQKNKIMIKFKELIGIDLSKYNFDCKIFKHGQIKKFPNNLSEFKNLLGLQQEPLLFRNLLSSHIGLK